MRDLMQTHALAFDYVDDGTMKIFRDAAVVRSRHQDRALVEAGRHRAPCNSTPPAWSEIEPNLEPVADEIVGGIGYPGDETGNARMFCEEMRRVCSEAGVRFRFAESVVEIIRKRKRIEGMRTAKETLSADAYVLAAGSFSSLWGKQLGFGIPVRPAKGYSMSVPMHRWDPRPRVPVVDDSLHAALVPVGGVLRVAGTAEFTGYDLSRESEAHRQPGRICLGACIRSSPSA